MKYRRGRRRRAHSNIKFEDEKKEWIKNGTRKRDGEKVRAGDSKTILENVNIIAVLKA